MAKKVKNKSPFPNVKIRPDGTWDIRISWTDEKGDRHEVKEVAHDHSEEYIRGRVAEIRASLARAQAGESAAKPAETLNDAIVRFKEVELVPVFYQHGQKVGGRKQIRTLNHLLDVISSEIGYRRLSTLTYNDLKEFKTKRLKTKTRYGTPRAISTVNREMQALRQVMFFAVREGWIEKSPFHMGKPLISLAAENARTVLWTHEEEEAALKLCIGQNAHMRPIIVAVTNGGFRRAELLKLKWSEVDFDNKEITILAENAKDNETRIVPMNERLEDELLAWKKLQSEKKKGDTSYVFGGIMEIKTAWIRIREKIGRPTLQIRDLRSVCGTRLARAGVAITTTAKILGHGSTKMVEKFYIIVDSEEMKDAVDKL